MASSGDNTDGAGLVRDLTVNLKVALAAERRILVRIRRRGTRRDRTAAGSSPGHDRHRRPLRRPGRRARGAIRRTGTGRRLRARCHSGEAFDLIINATSAGLSGTGAGAAPTVIGPDSFCYDMSYARAGTAFIAWAPATWLPRSAHGWGMLVEQAAESFELWRGVRPLTQPVLDALICGA